MSKARGYLAKAKLCEEQARKARRPEQRDGRAFAILSPSLHDDASLVQCIATQVCTHDRIPHGMS
jgi:hypothetical protein